MKTLFRRIYLILIFLLFSVSSYARLNRDSLCTEIRKGWKHPIALLDPGMFSLSIGGKVGFGNKETLPSYEKFSYLYGFNLALGVTMYKPNTNLYFGSGIELNIHEHKDIDFTTGDFSIPLLVGYRFISPYKTGVRIWAIDPYAGVFLSYSKKGNKEQHGMPKILPFNASPTVGVKFWYLDFYLDLSYSHPIFNRFEIRETGEKINPLPNIVQLKFGFGI